MTTDQGGPAVAVRKTAQEANANWKNNFGAAGPAYTKGVQSFQGDPTKLAAASADFWASQVAASKPTYVARLQAVPAGYWAQRASTVGATNLAAGATKGADKQLAAATNIINALQQIVPGLPSRGAYAANMARQRAFADAMHAKKGTLGA